MTVKDIFTAFFLVVGVLFSVLASVGMVRMPDVYTRMQAATKAGTLGVASIVFALVVHFADLRTAAEGLLVIGFFFVTAPIASHLIGRAAYVVGVPFWSNTAYDDLKERYGFMRKAEGVDPPMSPGHEQR